MSKVLQLLGKYSDAIIMDSVCGNGKSVVEKKRG
jgi:hypothetical protein